MKLRHVRGQDIRRHPSNWRKLESERERERWRLRGGQDANRGTREGKNKRGGKTGACIRFEGMELRIAYDLPRRNLLRPVLRNFRRIAKI